MDQSLENKNNILIVLVNEAVDVKFLRNFFDTVKKEVNKQESIIEIYKIQSDVIAQDVNIELIYNRIKNKYSDLINNKKSKVNIVYVYNLDDKKREISYCISNCSKKIKSLKKKKEVYNFYEIKILNSIEEWFLIDIQGICSYLNSTHNVNLNSLTGKDGLEKMNNLFKDNNRTYEKGNEINLIEHLNFDYIYQSLKHNFKDIIDIM